MIEVVRKLFKLMSRNERFGTGLLLCMMMLGSALEVLGVAAIPAFIGLLGQPERLLEYEFVQSVYAALDISSMRSLLLWASGGLLLVYVVKNLYLVLLYVFNAHFIYGRSYSISRRLFRLYLYSPYPFHLRRNTSELLRNVRDNVDIISAHLLIPLVTLGMEVISFTFIFTLLLVVHPFVTLIAFGIFGVTSAVFLTAIKKKNSVYGRQEQAERKSLIQVVNQGFGGLKSTIVLQRQNYFYEAFSSSASRIRDAARYNRITLQIPKPLIETLVVLGMLAVALLFLVRGKDVGQIVPTLALFGTAAVRLMPSLKTIISSYSKVKYYRYALDAIYSDIDRLEAVDGEDGVVTTPAAPWLFNDRITLEDVDYVYEGADEAAVKNVSLEIRKGERVAFVGPSGSGKTTLVDLILGLLTPTRGCMKVDGTNMLEQVREWQRNIGYIPQDIYLSDDTIRRNVAFGIPDEDIDDEKVWTAIEAAQLRDHVAGLPDRLETTVGEHGVRLSGGQRQRIGIARALYTNPEVLVMDEATAALDNRTEKEVMLAIEALSANHTVIMIAHRLSTVKQCDRLYYLEKGRINDCGSYEELLQSSREFERMTVGAGPEGLAIHERNSRRATSPVGS